MTKPGRLSLPWRAEKVPTVPCHVEEYSEPAVRFISRFSDELNAAIEHPLHRRVEVTNTQEQSNASSELPSNRHRLLIAVSQCQQQT